MRFSWYYWHIGRILLLTELTEVNHFMQCLKKTLKHNVIVTATCYLVQVTTVAMLDDLLPLNCMHTHSTIKG